MVQIIKYEDKYAQQFLILCKEAFPKHNIFSKDFGFVKNYLVKKEEENRDLGGVFIAVDNGKVVGGCLLKIDERSPYAEHVRYKYNHLIGKNQAIKEALIDYLDLKIKEDIQNGKLKSAKVELGLAMSELDYKSDLNIYLKYQFKKEGTLASHYRKDEDVIILGKEISI